MTTGSTPSKEQLVELVKTDLSQFNQLRRENPRLAIDLAGADLRGTSLKDANLGSANLGQTDLKQSDLTNANLHRARLDGADLRGATLGALSGDQCTRICLHDSSFRNVHLDKSQLEAFLALLNLNSDWEINYELVARK